METARRQPIGHDRFMKPLPTDAGIDLDKPFLNNSGFGMPIPLFLVSTDVQTASERTLESDGREASLDALSPRYDGLGRQELPAGMGFQFEATSPVESASSGPLSGSEWALHYLKRASTEIVGDYRNFYSIDGLEKLVAGLAIAAAAANTQMDREIQEQFQEHLRTSSTDSFARIVKPLGDGMYTVPVYVGAFALGELTDSIPYVGDWGDRSLRALAVGVPSLLFVQKLTGAERPELDNNSRWTPWRNNHGASGHAFMGAIPFLTAAKMADDPYLKTAFYLGSTLTAWSRVNDNAHYVSQAALGWWLAFAAVSAVDATNLQSENASVTAMPVGDGVAVGLELRQ